MKLLNVIRLKVHSLCFTFRHLHEASLFIYVSYTDESQKTSASSERRTSGEIREIHPDHHQLLARGSTDSITQTMTIRPT